MQTSLTVEQNAELAALSRKAETGADWAAIALREVEMIEARRRLPAVFPLYMASRAKRGLVAGKSDAEQIINTVGEIESLGNSSYGITVSDHTGTKYRVTVEVVS